MKIIDIASYQSVEVAGDNAYDGVIVKTTEGVSYVNPKADAQYQLAKVNHKWLGFYHYANGGDPVEEADFFFANSRNYFGEAVPFLDWESGSNAQWGNTSWCLAFVNRIHELSGVWCGIYIQASAIDQVANLSDRSALWIAGYPLNNGSWEVPDFIYSTSPWASYTLWQFDSANGLDKNIANITTTGWQKLAKGTNDETIISSEPEIDNKPDNLTSLEDMATLAIEGAYGDGDNRINNLGSNYIGVQAIINHRLSPDYAGQAVRILKEETLAGKYGNGELRKFMLGTYYDVVQDQINNIGTAESKTQVYIVQEGDTLSDIGNSLGLDWTALAKQNNIENPYIIYPGQEIYY